MQTCGNYAILNLYDEAIPNSVVKMIAKKQPLCVVFRDYGFLNNPSKINVGKVFKILLRDAR